MLSETASKIWHYWSAYRMLRRTVKDVLADENRSSYIDTALTPMDEGEFDTLALYHETSGGEAALARKRRDDTIRAGGHVPSDSGKPHQARVVEAAE
jgi:hypothetical protein